MRFGWLHLHPLHPIFFIGGMGLISLFASVFYRVIPFYRRELAVESAIRLTPLDGLRGILSFGVMYHHAAITRAFLLTGRWEEQPSNLFVLLGQSSVAFFFCITAFLFWGRALAREGNIPPFAFLRGRWFRIVPLYIFTGAVVLWIVRKKIHWHRHATWLGLWKMALLGLVSWGIIGNSDVNMINSGVTWTLQYEWGFYIALPALALMIRAGKPWYWLFVAFACWVISGVNLDVDFRAFFATGALAAHISIMPRTSAVLRRWYITLLVCPALPAMPILLNSGYDRLALLFTTLIFIPIACGNSLFGLLNFSGLRMMGIVSYSVYLLHGIFLFEGRAVLKQAVEQSDLRYWLEIAGIGCIVLMFSSLTYAFIEWPFIRLEKRWR